MTPEAIYNPDQSHYIYIGLNQDMLKIITKRKKNTYFLYG